MTNEEVIKRVTEIAIEHGFPTDKISVLNYSMIYLVGQRDQIAEHLQETTNQLNALKEAK